MSRGSRRLVQGLLLPFALGPLAGCGLSVDAEQARVCRRALPAVVQGEGDLRVLRVAPGPDEASVRIDFVAQTPGRTPRPRYVVCRFAAEGLAANKADLVGIATERGSLSGASIYLLKRYYLDTAEGLAGEPRDRAEDAARSPEIPRGAAYAVQQLVVGMPRTAVTALLASAYALVFGLTGRINLAFGEMAAVGGVAAGLGTLAAVSVGVNAPLLGLALAACLAVAAAALHNLAGGWFAIASVPARRGGQAPLIATVGLSLAVMEYLRLAQGAVPIWVSPVWNGGVALARSGDFVATITPMALLTAGLGCLAGVALVWLMRATAFGRAWRACADDAGAAALMGVDHRALLARTLLLSGALAGLAGALVVAQFGSFGFADGFGLGLKALIAAVLGGIGSVPGAYVGGLAIGLFETFWSALLPIDVRDPALYALLVVLLMFRPGGLFGVAATTPREV